MTKKDFIKKYKGVTPSVTGGGRYRNWTELEQDMSTDIDLIISLSAAPPINQRSFNMNQEILIKLKPAGFQRLSDIHNDLAHRAQSLQPKSPEDFEKMANKDGYVRMQMWRFMKDFGDVTGPAHKDHYYVDILLSEKDLIPYFKTTKLNIEE